MTRRLLAATAVLVLFTACGGGGDSTEAKTTTTLDAAKAQAEVSTMWTNYFTEGISVDDAVASLENGASYRDAIVQQKSSGSTKGLTVKVKDVQLSNPKLAQVTYDILLSGNVALPNSKGNAVYLDGRWKVSEQHFCVLLNLGSIHPPACEKILNP